MFFTAPLLTCLHECDGLGGDYNAQGQREVSSVLACYYSQNWKPPRERGFGYKSNTRPALYAAKLHWLEIFCQIQARLLELNLSIGNYKRSHGELCKMFLMISVFRSPSMTSLWLRRAEFFLPSFREQRDSFNVTVLKYMISGKTSFLWESSVKGAGLEGPTNKTFCLLHSWECLLKQSWFLSCFWQHSYLWEGPRGISDLYDIKDRLSF